MGKYLKQGFVRELGWKHSREEISYSKMVDLMEKECIKNYNAEMKRDKSWLILPMISFTKFADGTKEISFGWLTKSYWIKF